MEQIVDVPWPGGRISERNVEQIVDVPGSGWRIAKRIAEQIIDVPVSSGRATSGAAAATSANAESPDQGGFLALFPEGKKVRQLGGCRLRTCSRTVSRPREAPMRSSTSSTRASRGGAGGTQIASGTPGSWPIRMGPYWAQLYGGSRGS